MPASSMLSPLPIAVANEFSSNKFSPLSSWSFSGAEDVLLIICRNCWRFLNVIEIFTGHLVKYTDSITVPYLKQPVVPCYFNINTCFYSKSRINTSTGIRFINIDKYTICILN